MRTYWLSRNGGAAEGPFAEGQLLSMWRAGAITAADQVCEHDMEDWLPVTMIVGEMEDEERAEVVRRRRQARAMEVQARVAAGRKSPGVSLLVGLVIPGGGQLYAEEIATGLVLFGVTVGLLFWGLIPFAGLLWVIGWLKGPGSVEAYNRRLAGEG